MTAHTRRMASGMFFSAIRLSKFLHFAILKRE